MMTTSGELQALPTHDDPALSRDDVDRMREAYPPGWTMRAAGAIAGDAPSIRSDLPYADAKAAVLHDFERCYLADLLARADGNLSAAARTSGLDRKHLRTLARKHGLVPGGDDDE